MATSTSAFSRSLGSLLALAASLFSAVNGLVFVFLEPSGFGAVQCVFYRLVFLGIVICIWIKVKGQTIVCKNPFVWLGGVLWTLQVLLFYTAILYSYVYADVVTISFLSVALIAILGWLFLGEKCDVIDFVLIIFIIIGGAIVVQPDFLQKLVGLDTTSPTTARCFDLIHKNISLTNQSLEEHSTYLATTTANRTDVRNNTFLHLINISKHSENYSFYDITKGAKQTIKCDRMLSALFAALSTIVVSFWYIVSRKTKEIFHGTIVFYNSIIGVAISSIIATILGGWTFPLKVAPWVWLLAFCVSGGLGFALKVAAFQRETAAVVAIIKSSQIVFSYVLGIVFLEEMPTLLSSVGATSVFVTCSCFCIRRMRREKAGDEKDVANGGEHVVALLEDSSNDEDLRKP